MRSIGTEAGRNDRSYKACDVAARPGPRESAAGGGGALAHFALAFWLVEFRRRLWATFDIFPNRFLTSVRSCLLLSKSPTPAERRCAPHLFPVVWKEPKRVGLFRRWCAAVAGNLRRSVPRKLRKCILHCPPEIRGALSRAAEWTAAQLHRRRSSAPDATRRLTAQPPTSPRLG